MTVLAQRVTQLQETTFALQRLLPRLLAFMAILVIGYITARLLTRLAARLLTGSGFERMARDSDVGDMVGGRDVTVLLTRVVFLSVMLLAAQLAFGVFGPNPVVASLAGIVAFLPRLIVAIVIMVIAASVASAARQLVAFRAQRLGSAPALAACAYAVVLGIGVFAALDHLRVAPAIVNGLFYALLAIVVGVTVVAVGGGGIVPMRGRWEQALTRLDADAARLGEPTAQREAARDLDETGSDPHATSTPRPQTHAGAAVDTRDADSTPGPAPVGTAPEPPPDDARRRTPRRRWDEADRPPIRYRTVRRNGDADERRARPVTLPPWDSES